MIIETEGSDMKRPFCAVQIAAQRMKRYQPDGTRFRVLPNHDVPIKVRAQAVRGYGQEYLRQHGQEPSALAYSLFR